LMVVKGPVNASQVSVPVPATGRKDSPARSVEVTCP
jgi:hypothetical protein